MLSGQISIRPIQIYFCTLWALECYFCVSLSFSFSGYRLVSHVGASTMTDQQHMFKQDFNYEAISQPTRPRQTGRKVLQSTSQTSLAPLQVNLFFSEDAKIMLMESYSSDKDDDHLISIKFHFCPLSISSCRAGTGRLR